MRKLVLRLVSCLLLCILASRSSLAETPKTDFKLPKDDKNVYGSFENGLKYIIRHNTNPPGKFTAYIHIDTGSFNETNSQKGLAHFMEHMVFRGSKNFPEGKLVPFLNQMGMRFGADTNAHTNYRETVYKLNLPDNKPETIETTMLIFSDYVNGATLDANDIDHERGVILEENRTRTGLDFRLRRAVSEKLYPGTQLEKYDVIGDTEQIKTFPQSEFKNYWDTWYRPDKMTLIVAGDVDPQIIISVAKDKLGTFKARGNLIENQKAGLTPFTSSKAFVITDPELVKAEVQIEKLLTRREPITTFGQLRQDLIEDIGKWIVNRRIANEISTGKAPYLSAGIGSSPVLDECFEVQASASGNPPEWDRMLRGIILQIKSGLDHGFSTREIELAKQEIISRAELAVNNELSIDSTAYVIRATRYVGSREPLMSAQQRLDLTRQAVATLSPDEIYQSFKEDFQNANYAYIALLPQPKDNETAVTSARVMEVANEAWSITTEQPIQSEAIASILQSEPQPGKILTEQFDQELGLTNTVFENGVVLHHKFSDYKKDQVIINFSLPGGVLEESAENKGISAAASAILDIPATHRISSPQLRDLLTGKNLSLAGNIGLDSMSLRLKSINKDVVTGLQLVNALLTDGIIEQSTLDDWKQRQLKALEARKTDAQSQLNELINDQILAGDKRFTILSADNINALQKDAIEKWFHHISDRAGIEVTVIGDISASDATELVNKYIGSLPGRKSNLKELDPLRKLDRKSGPFIKVTNFHSVAPKAIAMAGFIGCNELDPERRPLSLIGLIMSDRMIKRIRVTEQLVYGISCRNSPGRGIPDTGTFSASAPTDPHNIDKLNDTIIEMLKQFAESGPTDEELITAKKQIANQMSTQMKEPEFWINQFAEMNYRGRQLDEIKSIPQIFQTFTGDDLKNVAQKYFKDERLIKLQVVPN